MSIAKTGVQVAVAEGVTSELTGLLTQFIMKHRQNNEQYPLGNSVSYNLSEITNPEYHKPRVTVKKKVIILEDAKYKADFNDKENSEATILSIFYVQFQNFGLEYIE
ncbi:hypothetical protein C2G38_2249293 [Gigaspora rosea]|uniref:Uncharacterized protein n=1 Tax=Gigaspora rosea TaxID=44941 RepID=A0A397URB7_9GLOM|nr:hypothetical protein C2G38_2249293 [Gigaspora rosea]